MKEKTLKTKGVEWTIGNYNRMNVLEGEEKRGYVQFTFESSEEGERCLGNVYYISIQH